MLAAYGLRMARDCDLIHVDPLPKDLLEAGFSSHKSQNLFYARDFGSVIANPRYHFYYRGIKFVALEEVRSMKVSRGEKPKDEQDIFLIDALDTNSRPEYIETPISVRRYFFGAVVKEKFIRHRVIRLFGIKVFKYNLR